MKFKYIVAAITEWNKDVFYKLKEEVKGEWYTVSTPEELNKLVKTFLQGIFFSSLAMDFS